MTKLVAVAAIGAAGYFAYSQGYFGDKLDPYLSKISGLFGADEADDDTGAIEYDLDGDPVDDVNGNDDAVPSGGLTDSGETNLFVKMLRDNEYDLNPWASRNLYWVAAICMQENRRRDPTAVGGAGEIGVMQVKPSTAADLVRWGWGKYPATVASLSTFEGGLYFGTAYLEYLSKKKSDRGWITKAYNGGPGFASLSANYIASREAYLAGVQSNFNVIRGIGNTPNVSQARRAGQSQPLPLTFVTVDEGRTNEYSNLDGDGVPIVVDDPIVVDVVDEGRTNKYK